jgi:hypothetical protein
MKKYRYITPMSKEHLPKSKRLPEYDYCLKEFLDSGQDACMVRIDALPSKDKGVILSSLKWRIKKTEFKNINVLVRKGNIYLKKVKNNE